MSSPQNDLDLSKIDSKDYDQLASKINTFYGTDAAVKTQLSWHWERNHLMLDGKQWLQYDGNNTPGGLWQRVRVSRINDYIPRPVTNYLYDVYQTLKSYVIKNKPRSKVFPNDPNSYQDKVASEIGTLCLEANWARLKENYNYETAASNLVVYGTVFKKSYWDVSAANLIKVPKTKQIPVTDPNTGLPMPGAFTEIQAVDPETGDPLYDELPLGDLNSCVVEPQRMVLDPIAIHLHDARWVMEYSIQPLEWVKETYDREEEGYTGLAGQVDPESNLNGSMRRWFQLRTTSGVKNHNWLGTSGTASSDPMIENACVVKEYYERPSAQYPKGRLVVIAHDKCVYSGESPYEGPEQGDWHPYSECRWELVPGRFWGKSPLDDACEIQKRINQIDSITILTRKTSAVPQKLIPMGSGIQPGAWTGRPNQEIFYRTDGTGAEPKTLPPAGVDPSVFEERKQCVEDLKDITGAIDILRGDRPPGVNAASALSLLYEVGTGKLYPILDRWKEFVQSDQKKQLRIIQKFYKEPRPEFIRYLKSKNRDLPESEINQFLGQDLLDNCNVVIEAGSNIPKLEAAHQSLLLQLAQMGMLNLQDPANRVQFQQDLGVIGYDSDIEPDRKRARWENDIMDNIDNFPDKKPVVLAADNHDYHIAEHQTRMKSPTFMSCSPAVQQMYMAHVQQHEQMQAMQQQAEMLQARAMGAPPAPPQGPVGPQGVQAGHGGGPPTEAKKALFGADVANPATLGNGR